MAHQTRCQTDRCENRTIACATAKVAVHILHNLGVGRFGIFIEQCLGRKDHAWRAKTALECELIEESLLDWMKPLAIADSLDCCDLPSAGFIRQVRACAYGRAVYERSAGAAYLNFAGNLQPGQMTPVSKNFSQGFLRLEFNLRGFSI